jgi:hypothetical protein
MKTWQKFPRSWQTLGRNLQSANQVLEPTIVKAIVKVGSGQNGCQLHVPVGSILAELAAPLLAPVVATSAQPLDVP